LKIAIDLEVPSEPGLALGPQKSMVFGLIVHQPHPQHVLAIGIIPTFPLVLASLDLVCFQRAQPDA
jgi:hypothetical protein